jgi:hypothetical protein
MKRSDGLEWRVWWWWQLDGDSVAGTDDSVNENDSHHASLADQRVVRVAVEDRCHQAMLDALKLLARIAQPRNLDHRLVSQPQSRAGWQAKEVDALRGDVLAHLPGGDSESARTQLLVQLSMNQVDLAEIGLAWVARYARAVLNGDPSMGVIRHA